MSTASQRSFGGVAVVRGNRMRRSISDEFLTSPAYSTTIDLSSRLSFVEVGAATTRMIFPFRTTVAHCFTGSVLASVATMVVMLGAAGVCAYVGAEVGSIE